MTIVKLEGKGVMAPQEGIDAGQLDAIVSDTGGSAKGGGPVNLLPKDDGRRKSSRDLNPVVLGAVASTVAVPAILAAWFLSARSEYLR